MAPRIALRGSAVPPVLRPLSQLPVLRSAEVALAGQNRDVAKRSLRVPADAFVGVRSATLVPRLPPPSTVRPAALPRPAVAELRPAASANDNRPVAGSRPLWREILFLALFGLTLASVYVIGRMHAFQNVIVVPEPWSVRSRIG